MPIGNILLVQAELKGHSSSINYIVCRLEQRQAAEVALALRWIVFLGGFLLAWK
jgi:hypothetical protein